MSPSILVSGRLSGLREFLVEVFNKFGWGLHREDEICLS